MQRTRPLFCLSVCLGLASLLSACAELIELPASADLAADSWLEIVDSSNYADSWDHSSSIFQAAVAKEDWLRIVQAVRGPLGSVASRTERTAQAKENPAGSPDGKYILATYNTRFEHKQSAMETLTLFQEADGNWKVAGYFVK